MFPNVNRIDKSEKETKLPKILTLKVDGTLSDKSLEALSLFLPGCRFEKAENEATIVAALSKAPITTEGYMLTIKNGRILIEYSAYPGLRNALATLSLLVREEDDCLIIPDVKIEDHPIAEHRGVMLDVARGTVPLDQLLSDMVLIAKSRYNVLHLHLSDAKGVAVEMSSFPEEYRIPNYYTRAEVRKIVRLADVLSLEIIPEFDMPAHSTRLNTIMTELRCDTDADPICLWTVCAGEEAVYELYEQVIREATEMFPGGRYFHIGGDELEFSDFVGEKRRVCHWGECRKCKKKMADEGIRDRQELYYYLANRMNGYVKACGRKMIMWSDQIDCTRPAGMSKDILMQFWRVAAPGRGPHEGCSMQGQLKLGYELINSNHPSTYVDEEHYMNSDNLSKWRWDEFPTVDDSLKSQIKGSEICAWEYGNREMYPHYNHSLPSAIVLAGDKLWSGRLEPYGKEAEIGVTRAVLGAAIPKDFNVFLATGDIYPPRLNEPCYMDKVTCSPQELEKIAEVLSDSTLFKAGDSGRARIYKKCAEYALEHLSKKAN